MKIRAKAEEIQDFLKACPEIEEVSRKSGWSDLQFGKDEVDREDEHIKIMWEDFQYFRIRPEDYKSPDTEEEEEDFENGVSTFIQNENGVSATMEALRKQRAYNGKTEYIETAEYTIKVECECGDVRWVKPADAFQVDKCKPCTIRERRRRQYQSRKARKELEQD